MNTHWRILVCGGRDWLDRERTFAALDYAVQLSGPIGCVIHGATGDMRLGRSADWLAEDWAVERNDWTYGSDLIDGIIAIERYPVDHAIDGPWPAAGHQRNARMLREALARGGVHGGIAFPGGRGTASMIKLLEFAMIPVWRPYG